MRTTSKLRRRLILLLALAVLAATSGLGFPPSSRRECQAQRLSPWPLTLPAPAIADFDGDRLLDRADLFSNGFHKNIHLTLSSPWTKSLDFPAETQQAGSLRAEDIDYDSDQDLVWISDQQLTLTALWLNNGMGEFTRVDEPRAYAAEIKRLMAGESQNGLLSATSGKGLSAIRPNGYSLLARPGNCIVEVTACGSPASFYRSWLGDLCPCISCHPKRGPPSFLA